MTTGLLALWLPILLSAVFVFILSSIVHMAPLWHKGDYPPVPDQEALRAALRPLDLPPGDYLVPRATSGTEMRTPEFQRKVQEGPVLMLTVLPNDSFGMARPLILWFLYALAVSLFAAYITGRALGPGARYVEVFRFAGATAFIGYSVALWQMSIWYRRAWSLSAKGTLDGMLYALLTAGTFGWLWPR